MQLGWQESTTSNADIPRSRRLPVDTDPLQPGGVPGTDEERGIALAICDEISRGITRTGFPDPIHGLTCSVAWSCQTMSVLQRSPGHASGRFPPSFRVDRGER
jgi:hypothetical protein